MPDCNMNDLSNQCYAIVPAAGRSQRMGQPKLLLPWSHGKLIDQVLEAWTSSRVSHVVVVVRRDDPELCRACERWPVVVVRPEDPPGDMKASVQIGLRYLESQFQPTANDRCFIAPADLPTLTSKIIDRLIDTESDFSSIVVPQFGDRQGHPALVPWEITGEIFQLAEDEGVDRVVQRHKKTAVPFAPEDAINDVDTPEEYQRALQSRRQ
jgi:molybdenum cofactor cytidylyltransferase